MYIKLGWKWVTYIQRATLHPSSEIETTGENVISSYRGTTFSLCEIPYTHSSRRINKPTVLFIIHFQFFLYEVAFYYVILLCYSRFSTFFCLISHCLRGFQSFALFVRYWHLLCCLMMHLILFLTLLPPAGLYLYNSYKIGNPERITWHCWSLILTKVWKLTNACTYLL